MCASRVTRHPSARLLHLHDVNAKDRISRGLMTDREQRDASDVPEAAREKISR
jgi:hypothetical protein